MKLTKIQTEILTAMATGGARLRAANGTLQWEQSGVQAKVSVPAVRGLAEEGLVQLSNPDGQVASTGQVITINDEGWAALGAGPGADIYKYDEKDDKKAGEDAAEKAGKE